MPRAPRASTTTTAAEEAEAAAAPPMSTPTELITDPSQMDPGVAAALGLAASDYPPLPVLMGRILAEMPAIGKDQQAPSNMGGYKFRGIEQVTAALRPAMANHGVFCLPRVLERVESERQLKSGSFQYVVDLHVEWSFYGPAGDSLTASAWGEGTDMGDKATQKAMTSAFKSMLMQAFCIGDSAEDSERHDVPETQGSQRRSTSGSGQRASRGGSGGNRQQQAERDPALDLGWRSSAAAAEQHQAQADRIRALDPETKEEYKRWKEDEGIATWPMAPDDLAKVKSWLDAYDEWKDKQAAGGEEPPPEDIPGGEPY